MRLILPPGVKINLTGLPSTSPVGVTEAPGLAPDDKFIIIIIIIAEMAVFKVAGYLRGKVQMACDYCFHTRTTFQINSEFFKKGTFR